VAGDLDSGTAVLSDYVDALLEQILSVCYPVSCAKKGGL
jgi:hypothetical protein